MKANEMPKRIYLFDYNDAMVTPLEGDTVYVREDAFIEKAVEWLSNNLAKETSLIASGIVNVDFKNVIEQFQKAMKL